MGQPAEQLHEATYADLEALPANMTGEILHGLLYAMPRPALRHARACTRLGGRLDGPFGSARAALAAGRSCSSPSSTSPTRG